MMNLNDRDKNVWTLISNVPKVSKPVAVIQALFNLIFPGLGTWISACADEGDTVSNVQMMCGLFQFLTSVFLIGWIWALYWSYLIARRSFVENFDLTMKNAANLYLNSLGKGVYTQQTNVGAPGSAGVGGQSNFTGYGSG